MDGERINQTKVAICAIITFFTTIWGWLGWLCLILAVCMLMDYITGTLAAKKTGTWSSQVSRDGRWHKLAIFVSVLVAALLDIVLGTIVNNIPGLELPFVYTVAFTPIVVVWYIITELGSILENSGEMGGPQPEWFKKAIRALKDQVDNGMGDNGTPAHGEDEDQK